MNQRNAIPANGINVVAVKMPRPSESSHAVELPTPSGILTRIRISVTPMSRANKTPAKAAARGVLSWCRRGPAEGVGPMGEDTRTSSQTGLARGEFRAKPGEDSRPAEGKG